MEKDEIIKWLRLIQINLGHFPEISNEKKIEALAEAIRLLKNEQSKEPSSSEKPNRSVEEKCPCYHCEYFEIKGWSHCKIHEDAYGDSRCNDYRKVNQDLNKVNQDLNKSENPTGSDDCISRADALALFCDKCGVYNCISKCLSYRAVKKMPSVTPQVPRCKECKWWKDSDGKYRRGIGAESQCPMNTHAVYCGDGYCYKFSPKEDREVEE